MGWVEDNVPFVGDIYRGVKNFVGGVISVFTGGFGVNFDSPDYSSSSAESIQGVLVNKDSAIADIPVVYGTRAVGGIRVFVSTGSGSNEYLYVAYLLSEGQVNGYTKLLIDDNEVTVGNYTHGTRSFATSGNYANESRLEVQFFDGRDDQIASTLLQEAPGWTSNHKLSGLAYIACKFRWKKIESNDDASNNPYGGGVPNLVVTLQGKKVFDITGNASPITYGAVTSSPSGFTTFADNQGFYRKPAAFTVNTSTLFATDSQSLSTYADRFTTSRADSKARVVMSLTMDADSPGGNINRTNRMTARVEFGIRRNDGGGNYTTMISKSFQSNGTTGTITASLDETVSLPTGTYQFYHQITKSSSLPVYVNYGVELFIQGPPQSVDILDYEDCTEVFSNNPVNVLLDYMRNPRYGKGLSNDVFHWDSFRTAAKLCDQVVSYTDSTTGEAFTCDAVIDTGSTLMDNIKAILVSFRGIMPYQQGRYVLKIEHGGDDTDITATPTNPLVVFSATNDNVIGGMNITGDSKRTKINRCRVVWCDPAADYQPNEVIWPEDGSAEDTQFLAEDGIRLEKDITLAMTAVREQALQAAEVFVRRSRNFKQISVVTNMAGSNMTVGDLFRVVNDRLGLDGIFRITDIVINESGNIEIAGFEHQSSAYGINAKDVDITRPTLSLPNPELVVAPTAVTVTSGAAEDVFYGTGYVESDATIKRLNVNWTATTDPFVRDYVIEYKKSTDSVYITAGSTVRTQFYITPVTLGTTYNVRVCARNELNKRSAFANASAHTVS